MQTIEAEYRIVTPMFIGGGDQSDNPELRPPSIKGALRFWWRAMQWGACLEKTASHEAALKELHRQEAELFGAAAKEENGGGQGVFFLKLKAHHSKGVESSWPKNNDAGAGFLGYGLDATEGSPHKKAIREGEFTLCLALKKTITEAQVEQLKQVLKLWGLLGGLGSRSRRGFGSVALKKLDDECFDFADKAAYFDAIRAFLYPLELAPAMPIFTALNQSLVIGAAKEGGDSKKLMDALGGQYKEARNKAGKGRAKVPFGLPLSKTDDKNRRSSPLLMHIHHLATGYIAIVSFISADFHHVYSPQGDDEAFYKPLQDYMATMESIYP